MEIHPNARANDLVIQQVGQELLVYDLIRNQGYCLNETAALVWQNCDGKTNLPEFLKKLPNLNSEIIELTVYELKRKNLLVDFEYDFSRRYLLKKAAMAGIVMPTILSLYIPSAAQAGSCLVENENFGCVGTPSLCRSNAYKYCCSGEGDGSFSFACTDAREPPYLCFCN